MVSTNSSEEQSTVGQSSTLLVVDDDEAVRKLLVKRIELAGYRCESCSGGVEGLERVARGGIDLVILDLMMPGMDGFRVLEELRSSHSFSQLPVIVLSAKDDSEDVIATLRLGANDYAVKPPDFGLLFKRIDVHLGLREGSGKQLGKYRLGPKLGAGGMAVVYDAVDSETEQHVALKVLPRAQTAQPEFLERFQRESTFISQINHPNVVRLYDAGCVGETYFIAMELVEGSDLATIRAQREIPIEQALDYIRQVASALNALHEQGIVHRDVKPGNVLVGADGVAKLTDFGVARSIHAEARMTASGVGLGSLAYASPEQLRGEAGTSSDVYSLGCSLLFLLTGKDPFAAADMEEHAMIAFMRKKAALPVGVGPLKKTYSRPLLSTLRKMMHPDPRHRFGDVREVIQVIDALLERPRLLYSHWRTRWTWAAAAAVVVGTAYVFWKVSTWG